LIAAIRCAEAVAVREDDARAECGDHERVGQPDRAGCFHEALAEQKIAIAVHDVERDAALRQRVQQRCHSRGERLDQHVVADPVLEQIAENENRIRLFGRDAYEVFKRGDGARNCLAQMNIREEKKRACGVRAFALARHARGDASQRRFLQH
jgi:hypothetical protein